MEAPQRNPSALLVAGACLLAVALAAAGILAIDHLGWMSPPGCGSKSPCRAAVASAWGKIPGVNWPVSFLGAGYFASMLAVWLKMRGEPGNGVRWAWRAAAVGSLLFIGVMLVERLLCPYCLTSHAANLAFVGVAEVRTRRNRSVPLGRGLGALIGLFAAASVALGFAEAQNQKKTESALAESIRQMTAASKGQPAATSGQPAAKGPTGATGAQPTPPAPAPFVLPKVFTGRFRWGPEVAPIRIVMFTGYQCPDCKNIEPQIADLMAKRTDISVSIKHFPFCPDCNRFVNVNQQANGCWSARAAEAAGILKGTDGFWQMHKWLFSRGGGFTHEDLTAVLQQFGWDLNVFVQTMQSPTTLRNVQSDTEEALAYGLHYTPMIFINGVELKGWNAPDSVKRAVDALAASGPEAKGPEGDKPVRAGDKYVSDWREPTNPAMAWPSRAGLPALGNPNAKVKVTVFGDLLEPATAEADATIRNALAGRLDMWYEFRYLPADKNCNPSLPQTIFPEACRAARAAEAANVLGGPSAYWKVHEWIMANRKTFSEATLKAAAPSLGLDPEALLKTMEDPKVSGLVSMDANIGMRLHATEIPRIFVNGKVVPRWRLENEFVLERIIEEAANEPPK